MKRHLEFNVPGVGGYLEADRHDQFLATNFWLLAVLFAAMPILWAVGYHKTRKRRRLDAGQCRFCGYDLRATPNRCPECGAETKKFP